MNMLEDLKEYLGKQGYLDRRLSLRTRFQEAVRDSFVREVMDIQTPKVDDFTSVCNIQNGGRLYVVRMDLNEKVNNHKKPVVAGLILRGVLSHRIPRREITTLIDGGSFNSAFALKYYTDRFDMQGMYVMSRLFPKEVIETLDSDNFQVIQAPFKYDHAREREFYEFLFEKMKEPSFRKDKFCLWHAKYGGDVTRFLGSEVALQLPEIPDYTVSSLGAGSTLVGIQLALKEHYQKKGESKIPKALVAEHLKSPLFARIKPIRKLASNNIEAELERDYRKVKGLPHLIIGPHYDEINPLLSSHSIEEVSEIIQYSDHEWKTMQQYLLNRGISVGNSSAANLSSAASLANEGNKVLTVAFEPFRDFYKKPFIVPWIFRGETAFQKAALIAVSTGYLTFGACYMMTDTSKFPSYPF